MSGAEELWIVLAAALALKYWVTVTRVTTKLQARLLLFGLPTLLYAAVLGLLLYIMPVFIWWLAFLLLLLVNSIRKQAAREIKRSLFLRGSISPPRGTAVVPAKQILVRAFCLKVLVSPPMKNTLTIFRTVVYREGDLYELKSELPQNEDHWLKPDQHVRVRVGPSHPRSVQWLTVTNEDGKAMRKVESA